MPTAFQILQVLPALSTPVKHSDNAAMISNMSALDDLGRADIKAIGIVGLIHMASSMPGSTDYRTNHTQLIQDATTFWGGVSNIDDNGTSKTVLIIQASLAWDIGKEVDASLSTDVNEVLNEGRDLRVLAEETLNRIAFLLWYIVSTIP